MSRGRSSTRRSKRFKKNRQNAAEKYKDLIDNPNKAKIQSRFEKSINSDPDFQLKRQALDDPNIVITNLSGTPSTSSTVKQLIIDDQHEQELSDLLSPSDLNKYSTKSRTQKRSMLKKIRKKRNKSKK